MCWRTVLSLDPSTVAISRLGRPFRTSRAISASRSVRPDLAIASVTPAEIALVAEQLAHRLDELGAAKRLLEEERGVVSELPPTGDLPDLTVILEGGRALPLPEIADITEEEGPAIIGRENARRRVLVEANVRGRDLGSFVTELERRLATVERPAGVHFVVTGQYEHLVHAARRFAIIVPLTIAAIFGLLYISFGRARPAALILVNVPVATSGGAGARA